MKDHEIISVIETGLEGASPAQIVRIGAWFHARVMQTYRVAVAPIQRRANGQPPWGADIVGSPIDDCGNCDDNHGKGAF